MDELSLSYNSHHQSSLTENLVSCLAHKPPLIAPLPWIPEDYVVEIVCYRALQTIFHRALLSLTPFISSTALQMY